jgi:DNA-directed RNA polymerase subunit RPC12/RpoP
MRLIDADALMNYCNNLKGKTIDANDIARFPTFGGWINDYEWICPACGTSILVKTYKQIKAIGMKLSVCPGCGKEILYGKAD